LSKFNKIEEHKSLQQRVYNILKFKIINNEIAPGSMLLEKDISEGLGVSRTPVREAVHKLISEGYLFRKRNRQIEVVKVSEKDYIEILQIRAELEGLATTLFTTTTTLFNATKIIKKLEHNIELTSKIITSKNYDNDYRIVEFSKYNVEFHSLILENCGNKFLIKFLNNIYDLYSIFRSRVLIFDDRLQSAFNEHVKILNAIKLKDIQKAQFYSRQHVFNSIEMIEKKINESDKKLLMTKG